MIHVGGGPYSGCFCDYCYPLRMAEVDRIGAKMRAEFAAEDLFNANARAGMRALGIIGIALAGPAATEHAALICEWAAERFTEDAIPATWLAGVIRCGNGRAP